MLLRRVMDHVKAQNWTAVALDFVIVVVGVFIGIQVSNWNAARSERAAEAEYLQALRKDAEFSVGTLERMIENMEGQQAARRKLYDFNRDREASKPPDDINDLLQGGLFNIQRINISQVAFNALTSSGQLSLIRDPELTTALQELDAAIARARQWQDETLLFTYEYTDPFLIEEADMEGVISTSIVGDGALLDWPVGAPHPETFHDALKSRRFKNLVMYQAEITNGRIQATRSLLEQYTNVLTLLDARQAAVGE